MLVGWVKLHREILEKAIWKCSTPEQKVVLMTIMMLANHTENQWIWKGKKFRCQPGQFITSLNSIAFHAGVSIKNVRTALDKFKKLEFLASEPASNGQLITICNWDRYQNDEIRHGTLDGKQVAKDWQTGGKGLATNKNIKKDNNKKKKKCLFRNAKITIQDIENAFKETNDIRLADAEYYFNAVKDWSDAKNEMRIDWIATARSFARKDTKDGKLKIRKIRQEYKKDPEQERIGEGKPLHEIIDKLKIGQ